MATFERVQADVGKTIVQEACFDLFVVFRGREPIFRAAADVDGSLFKAYGGIVKFGGFAGIVLVDGSHEDANQVVSLLGENRANYSCPLAPTRDSSSHNRPSLRAGPGLVYVIKQGG